MCSSLPIFIKSGGLAEDELFMLLGSFGGMVLAVGRFLIGLVLRWGSFAVLMDGRGGLLV
jgi:hypothetical protein